MWCQALLKNEEPGSSCPHLLLSSCTSCPPVRLWNDIIQTLRAGLPLRKVKKNLRSYENCIGSAEMVDWLHASLRGNNNFGTDVTREQTVQLLKKLHRWFAVCCVLCATVCCVLCAVCYSVYYIVLCAV